MMVSAVNDMWYSITPYSTGQKVEFQTQQQFVDWTDIQFSEFDWLYADTEKSEQNLKNFASGIRSHIGRINQFKSHEVEHFEHSNNNLKQSIQAVIVNAQSGFPISGSPYGNDLNRIKRDYGEETARWKHLLDRQPPSISQLGSAAALKHIITAIVQDFDDNNKMVASLKEERTRYRSEVTKLENRVKDLEAKHRQYRIEDEEHQGKLKKRLIGKFKAEIEAEKSIADSKATAVTTEMSNLAERYKKEMALLAPVQYWKDKAASHGKWEIAYALVSLIFFGLSGYLVYEVALQLANYFLNLKPVPGQNLTPIYFITTSGIIGGSTLLLWFGRLLVKLFLSEHHMRSDCKEKAIMTQAFLSMDEKGDFQESERAIVLSSVFRNTSDGIVKEEGPSDVSLQAMLSKILSR